MLTGEWVCWVTTPTGRAGWRPSSPDWACEAMFGGSILPGRAGDVPTGRGLDVGVVAIASPREDEGGMSGPGTTEGAASHDHCECGPRERLWLPRQHGVPSGAAPHPYCVRCGAVRDLTAPRARPLGYYLNGLTTLREQLAGSSPPRKLAQVQTRLIVQRLSAAVEFKDPYGTPGYAQRRAYVEIVRSVCRDLEPEDVLRALPSLRRRGAHVPVPSSTDPSRE